MRILVASVIAALSLQTAWAGNGIGVFGSYWNTDDFDDGYGGGAKLKVELAPGLCFEVRGAYYPDLTDDEDDADIDLEVIPVEGDLIVELAIQDTACIYGGGGVGYYFMDIDVEADGEELDVDVDDEIGYFAIAGLEVSVSDAVALFAEGKYTWLDIDEVEVEGETISVKEDNELNGFGANAGLLIKF
ncbi:MAG: hypothetical protein DRP22_00655 [Verrucomicrobia bacterium]|nr:MAG: hypothetical protein DRP22_00655 [Verrucomicrobiota bacterium]